MGAETRMVVARGRWGTWEELILGGAVLRHGNQDWSAVASELRARTLHQCRFTPEACKSKYEDLQQRYAGCTAWFEELRKQRVAELRQELEKSEDLIGSLESKLGSLKSEKGYYSRVDCGFSQTEFPAPSLKSAGAESFGKETSKDGLSAGSFTQDTRNWSSEYPFPATASAAEMDATPDASEPMEQEKLSSVDKLVQISNEQEGTFRKRRGKRKRKDCNRESKEGSIGDSENLGSTNVLIDSQCKENSISDCGQTVRSSGVNDHNKGSSGVGNVDLMLIFDSIAKNEYALVFRRRLDSQKRARYKKIIRQHLDFDTIRSRIANCSIVSVKELFRDLLLLANNALVFYSRRTREYKSALLLRDHVTKEYQQHYKDSGNKAASVIFSISSMCNLPVKPRSIRPYKRKLSAHVLIAENVTAGTQQGCKKPSVADSTPLMVSLMMANKGFSRAAKVALTTSNRRPKIPMKERKRRWRR
ncbi:uncharacterized protein LOC132266329 isoform X2 [Cornus florida]|uniref:uncharacterized protein LOC132266329 isoform X2 n=1 Tax=Cornus florida TaxID=4283 RepID=UPI00289C7DF0|nr:uncharacterized protein LOC132266329 isoform X2 [Cornus florida]